MKVWTFTASQAPNLRLPKSRNRALVRSRWSARHCAPRRLSTPAPLCGDLHRRTGAGGGRRSPLRSRLDATPAWSAAIGPWSGRCPSSPVESASTRRLLMTRSCGPLVVGRHRGAGRAVLGGPGPNSRTACHRCDRGRCPASVFGTVCTWCEGCCVPPPRRAARHSFTRRPAHGPPAPGGGCAGRSARRVPAGEHHERHLKLQAHAFVP